MSLDKMITDPHKLTVMFKAVGNAPVMKNKQFIVKRTDTVADLLRAIRKGLGLNATDSLHIFVNQAFSPSLDHTVEILKENYAANDEKLILFYSTTPAWG